MNIEQLFEKIEKSEDISNHVRELLESGNKEAVTAWIKEQGCDASLSEIKDYLLEKADELKENGELTPEQLEQASGGGLILTAVTITLGALAVGGAAGAGITAGVKAIISC